MRKFSKEQLELINDFGSSDEKAINALLMMLHKIVLLETWRDKGLPLIEKQGEPVLYPNCPKNSSQFIAWEDSAFEVSKTSRSFYHRKLPVKVMRPVPCPTVSKLRSRLEKTLDYWNRKGKIRQKRNKEIQRLRDKNQFQKEIIQSLTSQAHMLLEQKVMAENTSEEQAAVIKSLKDKEKIHIQTIADLKDQLDKKRGGFKSV